MSETENPVTIARYLAARLREAQIEHVFAVPAHYTNAFLFTLIEDETVEVVDTGNELEAGYAADAYARVRPGRRSALCVSYGVGALSALNAVAGSYTEHCSVLLISGGPAPEDREREQRLGVLFPHSTGAGNADLSAFEAVTVEQVEVDQADTAPAKIDRAFVALRDHRRPVYLQIAQSLWRQPCTAPGPLPESPQPVDDGPLDEAVGAVLERLRAARFPLILAGEELQRWGLESHLRRLLEDSRFYFSSTLLGKGTLAEDHPQFVGVYDSALSPQPTRRVLDAADLILAFGTTFSDFYAGLVEREFDTMVLATQEGLRVGNTHFPGVKLTEFLPRLVASLGVLGRIPPVPDDLLPLIQEAQASVSARTAADEEEGALTWERFFRRVRILADAATVFVCDTGLSLFPAAEVPVQREPGFIVQACWLSIGYSLGATLGAGRALPGVRTVTFIGDGAFQTSPQAVASLVRHGHAGVIFVIENRIYGIEQWLADKSFFQPTSRKPPVSCLALQPWKYAELPGVFGGGRGRQVSTVEQLRDVLQEIQQHREELFLVEVRLPARDLPTENRI